MKICRLIGLIFYVLVISGCGKSTPHTDKVIDTYIVKLRPVHKTLYFTGTLNPLHISSLTSPMDGIVESMPYHYGQLVKKDDVVIVLNSAELQREYNDTLTEYLKAKDSNTIAQAKFTGTTDLWAAGLISKNNYLSEKSSINTSRMALMQATRKLSDLMEKMGDSGSEDLTNLSFSEFKNVRVALTRQHNIIRLKAPTNGVLLYPPKSEDNHAGRISTGSSIKAGDVLALLGDLSGVSVEIDIPEVDLTEIKLGMPAVIRGVAFSNLPLTGHLAAINAQASISNGAALPSFTAIVDVSQLTKAQQAVIKVGMSASVELSVESNNKLLVPLTAITQEYGKSMVQRRDSHGKFISCAVVTGAVHNNDVIIESGLKAGDVIRVWR